MTNIIQNIKQGDKQAFEILFRKYNARLCAFSVLYTKDEEASREIVQDFFVKLWENRENLDINAVNGYLFRAIHNNSLKYIKTLKNFETIEVGKEYGFEETRDLELAAKIEKSISELPPKSKAVFIMSRVDKLKHNQISEKLGISNKTVEFHLKKASDILKVKLKDYKNFVFLLGIFVLLESYSKWFEMFKS